MKEKRGFYDIIKTDFDYLKDKLEAYAEFSYYKLLLQVQNLNYLPWVGIDFPKKKTLIVGESLYLWEDKSKTKEEILQEASSKFFLLKTVSTQGLLLKKDKKTHNFYRGIERLIIGEKNISKSQRNDLWKSVIFHQFIQKPMKNKDARPTKEDYIEGALLLKTICDFFQIDECIFLGSQFSKYESVKNVYGQENFKLYNSDAKTKIGNSFGRKRIAISNGHKTMFTFVRHPSAYFKWKEWHKFLNGNEI